MRGGGNKDLSSFSMMELFHAEAESQCRTLSDALVTLDKSPNRVESLQTLMRAAHSLKGAARIVGIDPVVHLSHAMEDGFEKALQNNYSFPPEIIDDFLQATDFLKKICALDEKELLSKRPKWQTDLADHISTCEKAAAGVGVQNSPEPEKDIHSQPEAQKLASEYERHLLVRPENLDTLIALAGESLVSSRRLRELVKMFRPVIQKIAGIRRIGGTDASEHVNGVNHQNLLAYYTKEMEQLFHEITEHVETLDRFELESSHLAERFYDSALKCRMRPFGDVTALLRRLVRDTARALGKEVLFEIDGEATEVDREMLSRLEAPLTHLLQNALDHGIESPEEREKAGKSREGHIRLQVYHSYGRLRIIITDDGRGVDFGKLRSHVLKRGFGTNETLKKMSSAELLDFLFLPGFSLRESVTELSGRGVGLDVVRSMVRSVRGNVEIAMQERGTTFSIQLPISLSIIRAVLVEIGGETYAIPTARIDRVFRATWEDFGTAEGRQFYNLDGERLGTLTAASILGLPENDSSEPPCGVIISAGEKRFALILDRLLGEQQLVVQPLDSMLGKVKDIAAAAVDTRGHPLLIIDVDDLLVSIERAVELSQIPQVLSPLVGAASTVKKILVVDDSLTVRELQKKLLSEAGYLVSVAVDGMDGWNALRTGEYDMVITDVDMPRMDGIELVRMLKNDLRLRDLPVMIVSYKDREEERRKGLEAGADYYLTKGSFQDQTFLHAVEDLIGVATP